MIDFHSPVFFAPAVVGLFTDTQLTGSLANGLALGDENLCLPEMTDDLFCGITFSCHDDPFLITQFLTIELGTFQGVRSVHHAEFRETGIRACCIYPGEVDTPILQHRPNPVSDAKRQAALQPEDVADAALMVARLPDRAIVEEITIFPRRVVSS